MYLSTLFALVLAAPTTQSKPAPPVDELAKQVEALAREAVEKDGVPGLSILVGRDRDVLIAKGWGYADAQRGEPASEHTAYSIGTLTRQFTAVGILQLVEAEKLRLDDELAALLPGFPSQGHKVTLRHLLTNTSGLPSTAKLLARKQPEKKPAEASAKSAASDAKKDAPPKERPKEKPQEPRQQASEGSARWAARGAFSPARDAQRAEEPAEEPADSARKEAETAELLALFRDVPFDFAPGQGQSDDNSGWLLLSMILSRVSGEEYPDYIRGHLLAPLELRDTVFCPRACTTQGFADDCLTPADERDLELPLAHRVAHATQSLCSTVDDVFRWQQAMHGRTLIGEASTRLLLATAMRDDRTKQAENKERAEFDGAGPWRFGSQAGIVTGFRSLVAYYPDARLSIVVLANCATAPVERIEKAIARTVLGLLPPEAEIADLPLEETDIARYAGRYQVATTLVRVFERDGKLWVEAPTQPAFRLLYQGKHLFVSEDEETRVTFQVEGDERAHGFTSMRDGLMSTAKRME